MIISFVATILAQPAQNPAPPPDNPFTQSVLLSGLVAGVIAGIISLTVASMNHRNETRKWLREEKLRIYTKFLDNCRDFIEQTALVFKDGNLTPDERYKKFLSLKTNEIRLLGSRKVVDAYSRAMLELGVYWRLVKDNGLDHDLHQSQVARTSLSIDQLGTYMRAELQEALPFYVRLWNWLGRSLITNPRDELKRHTTLTLTKNRRTRALRRNRRQRKRISRIRRKAVRKQRRRLAKASKLDA